MKELIGIAILTFLVKDIYSYFVIFCLIMGIIASLSRIEYLLLAICIIISSFYCWLVILMICEENYFIAFLLAFLFLLPKGGGGYWSDGVSPNSWR